MKEDKKINRKGKKERKPSAQAVIFTMPVLLAPGCVYCQGDLLRDLRTGCWGHQPWQVGPGGEFRRLRLRLQVRVRIRLLQRAAERSELGQEQIAREREREL